ncbi:MAG: type II toxin-antitoxin system HicB family antitoxin [Synergistaceae bacterium]|nr:type II toxin-antitoxin system HicB family antitoxin [Synergistaceae bacterium]
MKDQYVFPALFGHDIPNQVGVAFPDIPGCTAQGDDDLDAIQQAREALSLHLYAMEKDGDVIPEPSRIQDIKPESYETVVLIDVYMPYFRSVMDERAETRTVTLPHWLNSAAKKAKINVSQLLQEALMQKLSVKREVIAARG